MSTENIICLIWTGIILLFFSPICFTDFLLKPDESINRALSVQYESLCTQMKEIEKRLQEDKNPLFNSKLRSEVYNLLEECKIFMKSASRFYGFEEKVKKIEKRYDSLNALFSYSAEYT